ncbi:MAG: carbohydrate-binding family 9-like protein [Candidatus Latescibacteria bacterium]|nr:carbohydrate-binding family 9-like protein [Candidatus Latescibacterota bacterium]
MHGALILLLSATSLVAAEPDTPRTTERSRMADAFPWPDDRIERYTAYRATGPIVVDGHLNEASWAQAPRSPRFSDLVNGNPGVHDTRAAVLWDDEYLYVGYWIEEPFLEASLTERDAPIYQNNDVELFIAGMDNYYEFEINTFGTIYEVFFIWDDTYEKKGYSKVDEFSRDHPQVKPFAGVGFQPHPRGGRTGYWNWDFPGLQTAVVADGTINDNTDRDRSWSVELALPWQGMKWLAHGDGRALPPKDGDVWRMDFSRFNQYKEAAPSDDHGGWAWSPHGVWDSHVPECFPYITFSEQPVDEAR